MRQLNHRHYFILFSYTLIYYILYNLIAYGLLKLIEWCLGIEYIYLVNPILFVILLILMGAFLFRKRNLTSPSKISIKLIGIIILLGILFTIIKDPIINFYYIFDSYDIPIILENRSFVLEIEIAYLSYFILLAPIVEELFFRGFILTKIYNFNRQPIIPILYSSLLFSLIHFNPFNTLNFGFTLMLAFLLGLCLGSIYVLTKNILYPILFHCICNLIVYARGVFEKEYLEVISFFNFNYQYWTLVGISISLIIYLFYFSYERKFKL